MELGAYSDNCDLKVLETQKIIIRAVWIYSKYLFIYLFIFGWIESSLLCGLLSSCGKWGLLSSCSAWLLIVVASLVMEHRL